MRDGFVGGCCGSVAEHWRLKPEALVSCQYCFFLFLFQGSLDRNDPNYLRLDDLYWSS